MALDCSPQGIVTNSACFWTCIPDGMQQAVQTYLLSQLANSVAGVSTDPQTLVKAAACFRCLDGDQAAVQTYLLCQIATAIGA